MPSLSLEDFFAGIAQVRAKAFLDSNTSSSENAKAEDNRFSYGTRLWQGNGSLSPRTHAVADAYSAKLAYLEEADVTFRVSPVWHLDLGVVAGKVTSIQADRRNVALSRRAEPGEYFVVRFSTNMRSMHHVVSVSGLDHVVVPALPLSAAVDDVVEYGRCEMNAIVTSVTYPDFEPAKATGASFTWKQVY